MAAINDLIGQIQDPDLRDRIQKECDKLSKQKKFGLVFEEHLPEYTSLFDMPIKIGCNIMLKNNKEDKSVYTVLDLKDDIATCCKKDLSDEPVIFPVCDIVRIAEFGEPIYPYLKPVDSICNAPKSDLWHTLIEAENYHALQLLEYLYAGKVDCIYIDPPYNTGARDWKYNNNYVDGNDAYRHSKWLSMMEKRLKIAKKLLNPVDSVLIITIDEKEYLHLGCLLEELFPEAQMQMITTIIKPEGTQRRNGFSRTNEYIFFLLFGDKSVAPYFTDMTHDVDLENQKPHVLKYKDFKRSEISGLRSNRPNQFYPIFVDETTGKIVEVGNAMRPNEHQEDIAVPDGQVAIFPINDAGEELMWRRTPSSFLETLRNGYAYAHRTVKGFAIKYLTANIIQQIKDNKIIITDCNEEGKLSGHYVDDKLTMPKTVWNMNSHNSTTHGSNLIKQLFDDSSRFTFPKSLYAVRDALGLMTGSKPNALIVDFFAGSGTTLHAVNLLNAEDGGHRRCIMVTNNEVSDEEGKSLSKQGYKPGDEAWEKYGIARYVTWPRTICTIEGHDIAGQSLKGNYLGSDIPMEDGFKANAAYFKLGFLEKTSVALGRQLADLLPILWMKAGSIGPCPSVGDDVPEMLILPENKFAVLNDENIFATFEQNLQEYPEIQTVFLVTDYEVNYRSMARSLNVTITYQLYRDYLDNFRINHTRD